MTRKKLYKFLSWAIKIGIVTGAFWYIRHQVVTKSAYAGSIHSIGDVLREADHLLLALAFILMFLNWGIEALKWQFLMSKVEHVSGRLAMKAVFSGATVSVFTPNKVGEYAGRIFHLRKADRIEAAIMTMIGSMSQLLVTLVTGLAAMLYFYGRYFVSENHLDRYLYYSLAILSLLLIFLLLTAFFNAPLFKPMVDRIAFLGRYRKYARVFTYYRPGELLRVIAFCAARFVVFSVQFYILLAAFHVAPPVFEGLIVIALIFFIITVIPRPVAFAELGVRGSAALYFLSWYSDNGMGILSAAFSLWIINLAIPALIGSFFIFSLKFFRSSP